MKIDNPFNLLLEAAQSDLEMNTEGHITESTIINRFESIEECSRDIIIAPEAVPVFNIDETFLVDMNSLAAYMRSNEMTSVTESLDNIAVANNLYPRSIGLLVESDDEVRSMLEKASCKSRKAKNSVLDKIKKSTDITDKLKKNGYPVKKKKSKGKKKKSKGFTGIDMEGCKREGCGKNEGCEKNEGCKK